MRPPGVGGPGTPGAWCDCRDRRRARQRSGGRGPGAGGRGAGDVRHGAEVSRPAPGRVTVVSPLLGSESRRAYCARRRYSVFRSRPSTRAARALLPPTASSVRRMCSRSTSARVRSASGGPSASTAGPAPTTYGRAGRVRVGVGPVRPARQDGALDAAQQVGHARGAGRLVRQGRRRAGAVLRRVDQDDGQIGPPVADVAQQVAAGAAGVRDHEVEGEVRQQAEPARAARRGAHVALLGSQPRLQPEPQGIVGLHDEHAFVGVHGNRSWPHVAVGAGRLRPAQGILGDSRGMPPVARPLKGG